MSERSETMRERLREVAAEFLSRESNRRSLITVTATDISEDGRRGRVFVTVLPNDYEDEAVDFANRNRQEFGKFFQSRVRGMRIPHVEFVLDRGEQMRQRLDELS